MKHLPTIRGSGPGASRRVVAVDFGTRRVGLSLADPLGLFAQPFGTFSPEEAVQQLKALHAREGLGTVVIGWPLLESGAEGMAVRRVQEYVNRLQKVLPGVRFRRWDERYTSEEAKSRLRAQGRGFTRERVDTAAAGIILQEYLDARQGLSCSASLVADFTTRTRSE